MAENSSQNVLHIKKYSNRRFYDTTQSRHVTMGQMHELICDGHDLVITDYKTGEDLTNQVLTQIVLERDPPKLAIFPADVLHQLIRTQQQYLGTVVEQFFSQVLAAHKASQDQWIRFVRNTLGVGRANANNPFEWGTAVMEALLPSERYKSVIDRRDSFGHNMNNEPERSDDRDQEILELTRRLGDLSKQVKRLTNDKKRSSR